MELRGQQDVGVYAEVGSLVIDYIEEDQNTKRWEAS